MDHQGSFDWMDMINQEELPVPFNCSNDYHWYPNNGKAHQSQSNADSNSSADSVDNNCQKSFKCGLCMSDHPSYDLLKSHLRSETHRMRMAEFQDKWHLVSREYRRDLRGTATFFCDLCHVDSSGFDSFDNHSKGYQHRLRLMDSAENHTRGPHDCGLCQLVFSSEELLKWHLNSEKHNHTLKGIGYNWQKLSVAQQKQIPLDTFYCSLCNADCQILGNYVDHSASQIHTECLKQSSSKIEPDVTNSIEAKVSETQKPTDQAVIAVQAELTPELQKPSRQHQTLINSLLASNLRQRIMLSQRVDQTEEKLQLFNQESLDEPIRSELKREIVQLNEESEKLKMKRHRLMTDFNDICQKPK